MKSLKRVPLPVVVFAAALLLVPAAYSGLFADDGPSAPLGFAPINRSAQTAKATGSEIIVVLKNWEYTQTSTSPIGTGRVRD